MDAGEQVPAARLRDPWVNVLLAAELLLITGCPSAPRSHPLVFISRRDVGVLQ